MDGLRNFADFWKMAIILANLFMSGMGTLDCLLKLYILAYVFSVCFWYLSIKLFLCGKRMNVS